VCSHRTAGVYFFTQAIAIHTMPSIEGSAAQRCFIQRDSALADFLKRYFETLQFLPRPVQKRLSSSAPNAFGKPAR
jgi:hypothetical protein